MSVVYRSKHRSTESLHRRCDTEPYARKDFVYKYGLGLSLSFLLEVQHGVPHVRTLNAPIKHTPIIQQASNPGNHYAHPTQVTLKAHPAPRIPHWCRRTVPIAAAPPGTTAPCREWMRRAATRGRCLGCLDCLGCLGRKSSLPAPPPVPPVPPAPPAPPASRRRAPAARGAAARARPAETGHPAPRGRPSC